MVYYTSGLWLDATLLLFAVLVYMLYRRLPKFTRREAELLVIALVVAFALFVHDHLTAYEILSLELGVLAFNGLLNGNSPAWRAYYVIIGALYIALVHWIGFAFIAQAMLVGLLSCITNIKQYKNNVENRKVEVNRDFVHIAMGIILMAMFYFENISLSITVLMVVILGGILAISLGEIYKSSGLPSFMYKLERNGTALGHGALWLALGALLPVSFLSANNVLIVYSAIFIGDPVATIVGIHLGGRKLPYNKKKSIAGTVAYFLSTSIVSSFFAGPYCIVVGAVGAIVESMKLKLDDNFTVSLALVILILLLRI